MKLILDTLERARLATTDLSLADDLRIAIDELHLVNDGRSLSEISCGADALKDIRDHVASMPFETTDMDDGTTVVESLTPDAFPHWLATLEDLAQ